MRKIKASDDAIVIVPLSSTADLRDIDADKTAAVVIYRDDYTSGEVEDLIAAVRRGNDG